MKMKAEIWGRAYSLLLLPLDGIQLLLFCGGALLLPAPPHRCTHIHSKQPSHVLSPRCKSHTHEKTKPKGWRGREKRCHQRTTNACKHTNRTHAQRSLYEHKCEDGRAAHNGSSPPLIPHDASIWYTKKRKQQRGSRRPHTPLVPTNGRSGNSMGTADPPAHMSSSAMWP